MLLASILSGTSIALVVVMFALADDLPAPQVRHVALAVGWSLPALAAITAGAWPETIPPTIILVALGPLGFLALHHLLRWVFLRWKGDEPVLCFQASPGRRSQFWYEPERTHRVTGLDYLYSFLVGAAMLLSLTPAMHTFVAGGP